MLQRQRRALIKISGFAFLQFLQLKRVFTK